MMMKRLNIMTVMIIKTKDSKTIMIKVIKIAMAPTLTIRISMTINMINAMTKTKFKMTVNSENDD